MADVYQDTQETGGTCRPPPDQPYRRLQRFPIDTLSGDGISLAS